MAAMRFPSNCCSAGREDGVGDCPIKGAHENTVPANTTQQIRISELEKHDMCRKSFGGCGDARLAVYCGGFGGWLESCYEVF